MWIRPSYHFLHSSRTKVDSGLWIPASILGSSCYLTESLHSANLSIIDCMSSTFMANKASMFWLSLTLDVGRSDSCGLLNGSYSFKTNLIASWFVWIELTGTNFNEVGFYSRLLTEDES